MDNTDWHERFLVQAKWTQELRDFLYKQIGIAKNSRILEVGCGTGVITSELADYSEIPAIGIDIDPDRIQKAASTYSQPWFSCADVYHLPFQARTMDFVLSHFLFLWLKKPFAALMEIVRILKPGGTIVALAEPDYLSRIDHPRALWKLGEMQTEALINQGANPMMGRMLPEIFTQAGLIEIQYGVSGFQAEPKVIPDWFESEWHTLKNDLIGMASSSEIIKLKETDRLTRINGSRVLWVPTFYAYGKKPY